MPEEALSECMRGVRPVDGHQQEQPSCGPDAQRPLHTQADFDAAVQDNQDALGLEVRWPGGCYTRCSVLQFSMRGAAAQPVHSE